MMTAVDFLKTLERMCYTYTECSEGCPLEGKCYLHDFSSCGLRLLNVDGSTTNNHKEEVVQIVEQWGKYHPIKTRQSELLKIFPNARKGEDNIMLHCPQTFDPNVKCNTSSFFPHAEGCSYCRKKYWLEEVK